MIDMGGPNSLWSATPGQVVLGARRKQAKEVV